MDNFEKVTSALSSMQMEPKSGAGGSKGSPRGSSSSNTTSAPLAAHEDIDQQGYAVPRYQTDIHGLINFRSEPSVVGFTMIFCHYFRDNLGNLRRESEYAQPGLSGGGGQSQSQSSSSERRHQGHHRPKQHRERREKLAMQQGSLKKR